MKYSIILPVRNGGSYVKDCVASILNQSLQDFNLIVLDNCSTDGTPEWIRSLNDDRILIYPSDKSLTIEQNWSRITSVPKNEFITLIGHDDILDPNYLQTMDALITKHPSATLYQTHFRYIDSAGNIIRRCKPMDEVQSAFEFLAFFLAHQIDVNGTGFMVRSADYDRYGGIPVSYPNLLFADFELWLALSANGYKATAIEECFAFRLHQSTTTTSPDIRFQEAYGQFITYLEKLKNSDPRFDAIIRRYAIQYIRFYCKGLTHRLIRTPKHRRHGLTAAEFIRKNKDYASRLAPDEQFEPEKEFSVYLAKRIDSNYLLRNMFLAFKKVYRKPVYK